MTRPRQQSPTVSSRSRTSAATRPMHLRRDRHLLPFGGTQRRATHCAGGRGAGQAREVPLVRRQRKGPMSASRDGQRRTAHEVLTAGPINEVATLYAKRIGWANWICLLSVRKSERRPVGVSRAIELCMRSRVSITLRTVAVFLCYQRWRTASALLSFADI